MVQDRTGYRLEVATVRKLETESDAFAFGDKLIEKWYGTVEKGSDKGILLVVTTNKDGALTGGPKFLKVLLKHASCPLSLCSSRMTGNMTGGCCQLCADIQDGPGCCSSNVMLHGQPAAAPASPNGNAVGGGSL